MRLSVIGLGKLGLPMATLYASKGYDVTGLDANGELIAKIMNGECPIHEPDLPELLASVDSKLRVTTNYESISDTDIIFVIVPTPSDKSNRFDSKYVLSAIAKIGQVLKEKKEYCLIVITSTVMPGTVANEVNPLLERVSGKKCGIDFGLCYNPEFIALGSVINDMRKPDAMLIGESDPYAGGILEQFHKDVCENNPPVVRMSWWNAELAKLALNVFITTKISLANTFTDICGKIPGGDVDVVTSFLGLDSRIGQKYLKGGLGFGGPCFARDNRAFIALAKEMGAEYTLQKATDKFNADYTFSVIKKVGQLLRIANTNTTVSILGLTYKPNTNVVEESASLNIARALSMCVKVRVYDPEGMGNAKKELGDLVYYASSIIDCLNDSDLCIIGTPWPEFKDLDFDIMRHSVILDCWRMLDKEVVERERIEYHALGVNK